MYKSNPTFSIIKGLYSVLFTLMKYACKRYLYITSDEGGIAKILSHSNASYDDDDNNNSNCLLHICSFKVFEISFCLDFYNIECISF